ncbi:predicted protein, partial [Thalassiosira pseudonana CCMP1335]
MKHTIALATLLSSSSGRGATAFRSAVGGGAAAINVNRSSSATAGGVDRGRGATRLFSSQGFDTIALHGGYDPDPEIVLGLGQGAPRGVPVYRTTPYIFKNTEHAANLFKLKELGNIYSRL